MIRHYLKIAWRNLQRQKVLTLINISGLSIGLACFSLFLLYAVNEFSYDRFHAKAENIYRVYRALEHKKEWTKVFDSEGFGLFVKSKDAKDAIAAKKSYKIPSTDLNHYKKTLFGPKYLNKDPC